MKPKIPRYRDPHSNLVYTADSCLELRQAWDKNEIELNTFARGTYPGKLLAPTELKGVKSIGYWNIRKPQNWGLDWHTNEGIELCFLESGNLQFLLEDRKFHLFPGDLTITRPWIVHKLGDPSVDLSKLYWIILDVNVRHPHQEWQWPEWLVLNQFDISELTRYLRQNEQPLWKTNSEIRESFISIGHAMKKSQDRTPDSRLKIIINNLFVLLLELFQNGNIPLDNTLIESKRTVELFLKALESNLNESWNVEKMSEYCNLGLTRFTHYCKEIINCSPMEYLNLLRLNEAAKLLAINAELSVTDIAFRSGFSSPQYFNFAFKQHYKLSPGKYRNKLQMQAGIEVV
jgi:AraC-like DNA-binding protein